MQFETNRYSVPMEYTYSMLWLKAFVDRVEITNQETVIASHIRLKSKFQEQGNLTHEQDACWIHCMKNAEQID